MSNPRTSVDDLDFEDGLATDPSITASALALGRLQPTPGSLPAVRFTEGPLPAPAPSLPGLGFAPPSFRGSAPPPLPSRSTLVAGPPPLPSRASGTNPPATGSSLPAGIPPVSGPGLDIPAPPASLTVPARSTTGGSSLPIAPPSLPAVRPDSAPPARPAHADASGEASLSEPRLQQLFERYVESRRSTNEPVAGLTYERLADKLRSEAAKLKTTYKAQRVDYEVVVKDGKTILKPVLR